MRKYQAASLRIGFLAIIALQLSTTLPAQEPPDTIPPSAVLSTLADGDFVGGKVAVSALASDNVAVVAVEFQKDAALVLRDTEAPFAAEYDFNADPPDSKHAITVIAYDAANNIGRQTITVEKPKHDIAPPGANPLRNGAFFKVWAPHASQVALKGDFNDNSNTAHRLCRENEWWFGFQPGARAGQRYQFRINDTFDRPDPYGRQMEHSRGASIIKDPAALEWTDAAWKTPGFEDMIIYQLHVGTFVGRNDGQRHPGNFRNLLTKLDYIKSTGANMIELLPVEEVPGPFNDDTPYLGYNPVGLFAVEAAYGTELGTAYGELKAFVNAAHNKGLGVILDVVYNHFSDISGTDNWYWNYDGGDEGGDGGIYFAGQYTKWGPAPDWQRKEVKQYIEDNCHYWLGELHADGLRWDFPSEIKNKPGGWDAMRDMLWNIRQQNPGKILITENHPYERALIETGNFHSGWYVDFHHRVEAALKAGRDADLGAAKEGINGGNYPNRAARVIYSTSHDEAGNGLYPVQEYGGRGDWSARARARVASALALMSPGIPMLFQGEETLQDDKFDDDRDHAMNWLFEHDADGSRMLRMYRDASQVRWNQNALRKGELVWTHEDPNKVLAFRRDLGVEKVLVIVNFSDVDFVGDHSYGVSTGGEMGQWTQIFCSQDAAYGGWDGACNAFHEPFTMADGKIYLNIPKFSVIAMIRK